jgi:hypothetical protein
MSDLYPTKTRLALLRDVAGEHITRNYFADGERDTDGDGDKVTARIAEAEKAGWVHLDDKVWTTINVFDGGWWTLRYWRLTDAGRALLDGAL